MSGRAQRIAERLAALTPDQRLALEARLQRSRLAPRPAAAIVADVVVSAETTAPVSYAQQRLWLIDRLRPQSPAYNMPAAMRLRGIVRHEWIEDGLRRIIDRHAVLRTTFRDEDGAPVQVVHDRMPFELGLVDLSAEPAVWREQQAAEIARQEANQPFSLSAGPLIRAKLIRLAAADHVFLVTMHHIVSDGWSFEILLSELNTIYQSLASGREPVLPLLALQYTDYARSERAGMQGERLQRLLEYWRDRLEGAPPRIALPIDRAGHGAIGNDGALHRFVLAADVVLRLHAVCAGEQVTPYMACLAAFLTLLHRYSGQADMVVGTAVSNRPSVALEALIGFFVNNLAIRVDFSERPTFRQTLQRVRTTVLEALRHQDLPFDCLVQELRPDRVAQENPLFQIMFAFQSRTAPRSRADASAWSGSGGAAPAAAAAAKFDLSLLLEAGATDVVGLIEYRTAILEASTIARMAAHFEALLRSGLDNLDYPIDRLPWPRETDRVGDAHPDEADGGRGPSLHLLVHRQAIANPAKAAVRAGSEVLSYGALDRQASQLAHFLIGLGVQAGEIVGLCFDPSFDMVTSMFAAFKAGAGYLPLDPAYPVERLRYMIADAGARVVLTSTRFVDRFDAGVDVVDLDAVRSTIEAQSADTTARDADEDDLAYIIYTSGSSGRPKGVAVPHTALFNVVSEQRRLLGVNGDSLVLQVSSFGFDASMFEIAMALGAGACLVLPQDRRDLESAALEPEEARRLVAVVPPSLIAAIGPDTSFNPGTLILAGEAFNAQLATPWLRRGVHVFNAYGPTETTIWTCLDEVAESAGRAPIGRTIRNVRVEILDDWLVRMPTGVPGEICIGGPAVAWGYVGRPDLTAEHFVPDPYSSVVGARLYRTGDRGRRLADGRFEFLGRRDHQVKLRGYRVEIGEVEAVVAEHPAVAAVAVTAAADLVAYVVCRSTRPSQEDFVEWTASRLPPFMVPSIWVHLDALPLLPSGKVDRSRLPAPYRVSPPPSSDDEPATETERSVAAMFAELLEVDRVGLHDNFFRLGGHSLLAARLLARVAKRFGVSLSLRQFFDGATAASVVEAVLAADSAPSREASVQGVPRHRVHVPVRLMPHLSNLQLDSVLDDEFVPLSARVPPSDGDDDERVTVLPASFSQQRLWFLDKLAPGSSFYNIPIALPMHGPVDAVALRRAVDCVVARHEALRTCFAEIDGAAVQVVVDRLPVELPVVDLAGIDITEQHPAVERLMSEEALAPFNLGAGPLIRAKLLRLSTHEHLFLLTVHHIVCDGWSVAVVAGEIEAFYMRGPAAALPELPVQFGDCALHEQLRMQGPQLGTLVSYWRLRLSGIPAALPIPTDYARPAMQSYRGQSVQFEIAPETTARLLRLASETRSTLFMTLLAAFQTFLSRLSGERDIVVGSPVANRGCIEVEHTVGFFVNNVVLRTQVTSGAAFRQVLEDVRRRTIEDFDHAALPFDRLVEELQPERLLSRNPLFQVMFVLQNTDQGVQRSLVDRRTAESAAPSSAKDRTTTGTAKFDLLLAMRLVDGHLGGALECSADLFTAESGVALSQQFSAWLDAIVAAPETSIDDLSALSGDEWRRLLEWGDGGAIPARAACVHQLLAAQAADHPEAPAIRTGDNVVSYGDLQARVRRLACVLVQRGVRQGDAVGICMERSVDLVVATAAVATAGAHYVLLEPSLPPGRTAFALRHIGAVMLIVHAFSRTGATEFDVVVDVDRDAPMDGVDMEPPPLGAPDSPLWRSVDITTPDEPRMVVVSHAALLAGVLDGSAVAFDGCRRTAQASPLTSYLFAVEVWGTLLRGGELVLLDADPAAAPERFVRELRARHVDLVFVAPSTVRAILDQVPGAFSDVTTLVLAGEPPPTAALESIFSVKPPQRVVCGLGGIEHGGFVVLGEVAAEECRRQWLAIGRPVAGIRCRVVDDRGRFASVGIAGRLCIEGSRLEGVRLTAVSPAEELSSGYRVRWRSDGRLEFLGRNDRCAWLSGTRVDLNDIEMAVSAHPGVRRCAVRVWTFPSGDERPIAYVVPRGASAPTTSELRRFLRLRLPAFMVPVTYIEVEEIPAATSGDADFGSLPPPDTERPDLGEPYVAPSTAVQRVLFRIWSEVFGVERIGIYDNFFQLGGHSLLAARVMSRAADAFQVELPLRTIFEDPTIAGLAERIEELRSSSSRVQPYPIVPVRRDRPLPLSFAQRRMWFLDRLHPSSSAYNMPTAVPLQGPVDAAALERALLDIGRRHESLRTRFVVLDDEPMQVIEPEPAWKLRVSDLRSGSRDERLARARERWAEETRQPFALESGPLVRCLLLRLDDHEHVLILTMHHIVADGWSLGLFFRELGVLYDAAMHGWRSPLAKLPVQYADYAVWQQEWLRGGALDAEVGFWRQQLTGAPTLHGLPTDRPRPPTSSFRGDVHHFTLQAAVVDAARRLGERCGATLFMTLLTAFNVLIARYGGDPHVVVGAPVANRPRPELEPLIGFFVNTLPLYCHLDGNPTFVEALMLVRTVVLEAYEHQALPFEQLVEILQPDRHLDRHPIFQISFVLQNELQQRGTADRAAATSGLPAAALDSGTHTARFDLTLAATETDGDLPLAFEYSTDLFDASSVREMAAAFCALLGSATRTPDRRIADLSFGNTVNSSDDALGPRVDWGAYRSVPTLIEHQMRRTPDRVAVVFGAESWTYEDLERRSRAVVTALCAAGVGPESAVGVFARRSARLVAAIVGILRSGAAFVPLDPDSRPARLKSMVQDASVDVVLADRVLEVVAAHVVGRCLVLEDLLQDDGADRMDPVPPLADPDADQSAYVIFTSGSTGQPKGCINTHGGLRNRLLWMQAYLDLQPDDVVLQKTPFTFDVSVWEFLLPLLVGARLVVAEPDGHRSAGYLVDTIAAHGVTTVHFVPSMLQVFLSEPDLHRCGALRRVICSGEALTAALRDRCLDALDAELFNLYGPTEASIDVTAFRCDHADRSPAVPIGSPIANAEVYVLDEMLRPVPRGVPGEIYLGGVPLARAYANRPDLTAERFVPSPLSPKGGQRLYRTGDRARRTATGAIEYLGRVDDQIKLGGVRIEPGEIESHIIGHPGVERAAVAVCSVDGAAERLVGYIVPDRSRSLPVRRGLEPFEPTPFVRTPEEIELPNGMAVYQMNRSETSFLYREILEEHGYERFGNSLQGARTIVDVGAHIGLFSLYSSLRAPGARIIAIEPVPDLARVLRHNLHRYDVDASVIQAAAGCEETSAELTYFPGAALISGRHDDPAQARGLVERFVANVRDGRDETAPDLTNEALLDRLQSVQVPCRVVRLSDVLRSHGVTHVDFLKIDVEGGELEVLQGIDDEHWSGIRQVALEVLADGGRLEKICELLRSRDFVVNAARDPRLHGTDLVQLCASRAGDTLIRDALPALTPAFKWCSGLCLVDDLRRFLERSLPAQMVPSEWRLVNELPVTGSGKLDRRKLTDLSGRQVRRAPPFVAARSEQERIVALVWAEVLRVDRIGVHDNFFELGGHSLLAARGAARLRDRLSIDVPVRAFFEYPTVAELTAALTQCPTRTVSTPADEVPPDDIVDVNLLSDAEVSRRLKQLTGSGGIA